MTENNSGNFSFLVDFNQIMTFPSYGMESSLFLLFSLTRSYDGKLRIWFVWKLDEKKILRFWKLFPEISYFLVDSKKLWPQPFIWWIFKNILDFLNVPSFGMSILYWFNTTSSQHFQHFQDSAFNFIILTIQQIFTSEGWVMEMLRLQNMYQS